MVELSGVILALSIEVLVGVILAQLLKATSGEKTALPGTHRFVPAKKFHCLAGPIHSRVSAPAKKPRDVDEETKGQRPADAEARGLRLDSQRDQVRSPN